MGVNIEDRPIETVREEVIDQLIMNYSHGKISYEAFDRRLEQAMECNVVTDFQDIVDDLPLSVDKSYIDTKKQEMGVNFVAGETEEYDYIISVFGGGSRSGAWKIAEKTISISLFGGSEIDFTNAVFTQPKTHFYSFNIFGGDALLIPENVNVVTKTFSIFGGVDYKAPNNIDRNAPTIVLSGINIFGGVSIEVKKPLKEKFVSFADNLKKMFS